MNKKEWEEILWLHTEKQTVTVIKMENGGDKRGSEAKPPASYNRRKKGNMWFRHFHRANHDVSLGKASTVYLDSQNQLEIAWYGWMPGWWWHSHIYKQPKWASILCVAMNSVSVCLVLSSLLMRMWWSLYSSSMILSSRLAHFNFLFRLNDTVIGCGQMIRSGKKDWVLSNKSFEEIRTKAGSRLFSLSCEKKNEAWL